MSADRCTFPIDDLVTVSGWHQQRVTACFDDVGCDDTRRIARGLDALAALLDAGASEALLAAEFRRRGLGEAALALRLAVIRARRVSKA